MLASLGAAIFGALRTARSVSQLSPAEAMRPPAPLRFGRTLVERLRGTGEGGPRRLASSRRAAALGSGGDRAIAVSSTTRSLHSTPATAI